ncbi:MAG: hypothetical protein HYW77_02120 [Parcubacteria group bacterium]|nr:hypothetical protein [Parcubacteria group bacterium]
MNMSYKTYSTTVGVIFLIIAILHLFRLIFGWNANIGGWEVPMWFSVVFIFVAGYLGYQSFKPKV